jgi:type I restriction enzyme M protein
MVDAVVVGEAGVILKGFRTYVRNGENQETIESFIGGSGKGFSVSKERIAETGDYSLSSDKYKLIEHNTNQTYPLVKIEDVITTITPPSKIQKSEFNIKGKYPIIDQSQDFISGWTDNEDSLVKSDRSLVIFGDHTCAVKFMETPFAQGADGIKILKANDNLLPEFLYFYLKNKPIKSDGYKRHFSKLKETTIPLPPLEVQKEIVEQIEVKQKAIEGAKQVIENLERERRYFGQSLRKLEGVEWVKLKDITELITKGTTPTTIGHDFVDQGINFVKIESISESGKFLPEKFAHISMECHKELKRSQLENGDILFSIAGALGRVGVVNEEILPANTNQALSIIRLKDKTINKFVATFLSSNEVLERIQNIKVGVAQYNISLQQIGDLEVPLVGEDSRNKLLLEIINQDRIVESNKNLIEIMEKKIEEVLSEI